MCKLPSAPLRPHLIALFIVLLFLLTALFRQDASAFNRDVLSYWQSQRTESLTRLAIGVAELGDTTGMTVLTILCVIYFVIRGQRRNALMLAFVMILGSTLNYLLKLYFADPRPVGFDPPWHAHNYSFPSGHAQAATAFCGTLMVLIPRWFIIVPGAVFALGIYWCRLYLGVHWPTDVLAGILVGVFAITLSQIILQRILVGWALPTVPGRPHP